MPRALWFQSRLAILVWSVLLPPVGLILLLIRPSTGIGRKLVGSMAIVALGIIYLVVFFGLRVVPDGSGLPKIVTFESPEARAEALERSRAAQAEGPAALGPATDEFGTAAAEESEADPASLRNPEPVSEVASSGGVYWTDFRGPERDGHYEEMAIRTAWPPEGLTPLWRQPVGGGYASFVIAQGRAFTIEQRRNQEVVAAYDIKTGRELWTQSWVAEFQERMGGDGPRSTPTWHEGKLYALGATGEFRALDASTGKILWAKNILTENRAQNLTWGMAASPLIVDDKVIVLPGGSGASIVAYDKQTGDVIWKALTDQQAYTSPMLVTLAGERQILVVSAERIMGVTVEDGTVLWDVPWVTQYGINAAQPIIVDENHFFISAGYGHGAALIEVRHTSDGMTAQPLWQNINMKNKFTSSVLHEGYVYGLDEAILACIDVRTGKRMWKGGRYGYGQVILASEHLIVLTERGDLVLVKATPERHEEVARFSAIEGKTWNHPAMADGILLVRNLREMAAFELN